MNRPKKIKPDPTRPDPVHIVSEPGPAGLARYINCYYEPEPDLNPTFF